MKAIIVYFSRTGGNYVNGSITTLAKGNTEIVAEFLRELTGADLFRLEMKKPYSDDYMTCIEEAKQDKARTRRPELTALPESMEEYDTVYLGFPNYWGTMPMAVCTFLEAFDFAGKTIRPFCTHEGSGMGSSEADIQKCCPKATIGKGLPIHGGSVANAEPEILAWLKYFDNKGGIA